MKILRNKLTRKQAERYYKKRLKEDNYDAPYYTLDSEDKNGRFVLEVYKKDHGNEVVFCPTHENYSYLREVWIKLTDELCIRHYMTYGEDDK